MNKQFVPAGLVSIALGLGAQAALAGHYGHSGKPGYGGGYGMPTGHAHGHHGYRHGMGYRPGHWGPPKPAAHHHRHAWSKKHGCQRGAYRSNHAHGYPRPGKTAGAYAAADNAPAARAYAAPKAAAAGQAQGQTPPAVSADIVEIAGSADAFATLVSAVKAAGLVDTLRGEGPFTVFAPTDAAFNRLPEGKVADLLGDTDALTSVLTYHVVAGRLSAADLLQQGEFETLNGATLSLSQLAVSQADVEASNGIIHIVDEVLLPPSS